MSEAPRIVALDRIEGRLDPVPWSFALDHEPAIEAHWQTLRANNPSLFNGQVLLLHRWSVKDGCFSGTYLQIDYRAFLAWRDSLAGTLALPADRTKANCFAMAALQAGDGAFLLGEMAANTANPGKIYFPAGTPDPHDLIGERVDLAGSAVRELIEETGLQAGEISVTDEWSLVEVPWRFALMRRVRSALGAEDLRDLIEARLAVQPAAERELSRMHIVRTAADIDHAAMPPFQVAWLEWALAGCPS